MALAVVVSVSRRNLWMGGGQVQCLDGLPKVTHGLQNGIVKLNGPGD